MVESVDQMYQNPGALDVLEKLDPQPGALVGALDEARDIGHHKGLGPAGVNHAQIRG